MARDKRVFSYAAKAHPALAVGDELVAVAVVELVAVAVAFGNFGRAVALGGEAAGL